MGRQDFIDDPHAPVANSLVPAASVVVTDHDGRILLQRRRDNHQWALPGGVMEIGETLAGCAERETFEETGFHVSVDKLVGVYTDPRHVFAYDDGEVRQEFSVCFHASIVDGKITVSDESSDVAFFDPDEIPDIPMVESIRLRILDYLADHGPAIR